MPAIVEEDQQVRDVLVQVLVEAEAAEGEVRNFDWMVFDCALKHLLWPSAAISRILSIPKVHAKGLSTRH
jgi:hypothetical protein